MSNSYIVHFYDGTEWRCSARSRFEAARKAQRAHPDKKIKEIIWA